MIKLYREHPLKILKYSAKNIWLLIFPLIRGIKAFTLNVNQIYEWVRGAWFDILIILLIIVFGYIKWLNSKIRVTECSVVHQKGIFLKVTTDIPFKNISSITFEHSFYLRPFKAVRFYIDTCSGSASSNDLKLLLKKETVDNIAKHLPKISEKDSISYSHKPKLHLILLFSALFSSSFSGVIYIIAFFFQGGEIAEDIIRTSIDIISAETSKWIIAKLPPVIWGIIVFILSTWFLSFTINLFRYSGFSIIRNSDIIKIKSGFLTKRRFWITMKKINFIDIKQNIIMKIFKVMSINISCSGYGSGTKNMPVLVPLITKNILKSNLSDIVHAEFSFTKQYHPKPTSFWQYIWLPVIISVSVLPVTALISYFFPSFHRLAMFITIMTEIPAIWSILVRFTALLTNGITINDKYIQVNYSKGFIFHTVIAKKDKIVKFYIKQSPFQRLFKKCTVCIYFGCEHAVKHSVKAITLKDAEKIFNSIK